MVNVYFIACQNFEPIDGLNGGLLLIPVLKIDLAMLLDKCPRLLKSKYCNLSQIKRADTEKNQNITCILPGIQRVIPSLL